MKIYKEKINNREQIVVQTDYSKFIICFYDSELYWIMLNYVPNNKFTVTEDLPHLFDFLKNLFYTEHFKNNTFVWLSESRLQNNSSSLKITKGMNYFRIRFIQNEHDYLAKANTICPICFCLSDSRNQRIANKFSIMLQELLTRDIN